MSTKKITIAEQYNEVIAVLEGKAKPSQALIDFIIDRKEKHEKRGATPSKTQTANAQANAELKAKFLDLMTDGKEYSVSDFMKEFNLTNQKASYLLTQLKNENEIIRIEKKGKAYFTLVTD